MYSEEFLKKYEAVLNNEAVLERLAEAESEEELKRVFLDQGLELTETDLSTIASNLKEIKDSGELSEEMLEAVSGGFALTAGFALVCIAGVTAGIVGAATFAIGKAIVDNKNKKNACK